MESFIGYWHRHIRLFYGVAFFLINHITAFIASALTKLERHTIVITALTNSIVNQISIHYLPLWRFRLPLYKRIMLVGNHIGNIILSLKHVAMLS